jgi:CubicO group peptidase (beta-lactamase class C family)
LTSTAERAAPAAASPAEVGGFVAPGYERVRDEFERNFAERRELGGAVAAYLRGEKVVDLWGGVRDARDGSPWQEDTLVVVYSTSKGLAAMCLALAHSRGLLDYDERVAAYWPEFAQNGKNRVTVRQLLAHEAGLPVVDEPLYPDLLRDFDRLADAIARQKPMWRPGSRHGYHGVSLGWYMGELMRRVDPEGRTLGRVFREDLAGPLGGLDVYFGVPDTVSKERIARIERTNPLAAIPEARHMPTRMALAFLNPRSVTFRTFANPRIRRPADLDRKEYRGLEFPAGGAVGSARAIARAYSDFAAREPQLGLKQATLDELVRFPDPPELGWQDVVLKVETAFSLGYTRPLGPFEFGSSEGAFGHPGAGGSFAFADRDREVSFCYVTNRLGFYLNDDPREKSLRDAVYSCLS